MKASAAEAEAFYSRAYSRIIRIYVVLALGLLPLLYVRNGLGIAGGFLFGAAAALVNLHWTRRGVEALAESTISRGSPAGRGWLLVRFLLRYALLAMLGYVILKGSTAGIYGFLGGLFLPAAAMMLEAGYELFAALRRGV